MSDIGPELPADIEALQALVVATRAQLDSAIAERDAMILERDAALSQNDRLRHLLQVLQRAQFGRRSEKLDPDQLLLAIEDHGIAFGNGGIELGARRHNQRLEGLDVGRKLRPDVAHAQHRI